MKKSVSVIILIILFLFFNSNYGECIEKSRREKWPVLKNAIATIDGKKFKVYYDPRNKSHIFLYQGCWLIRRDIKIVGVPNCIFELDGDTLYHDKTRRNADGYLDLVKWGDPKMDNISFFSSIFRKPKFGLNSVSIWDGNRWIHIEGLPALVKDTKKVK